MDRGPGRLWFVSAGRTSVSGYNRGLWSSLVGTGTGLRKGRACAVSNCGPPSLVISKQRMKFLVNVG